MNQLVILAQADKPFLLVVAALFLLINLVIVVVLLSYFRYWLQAFMSGAAVPIVSLLGMSFRKVPAKVVVPAYIQAVQSGLQGKQAVGLSQLEAHYLAGGNVPRVIEALIVSSRDGGTPLSFDEAAAIDLSGRDVMQEAQLGQMVTAGGFATQAIGPVDNVEIDGQTYTAVSRGGSIGAGSRIEVVGKLGNVLIVQAVG